MYDAIVIGGGPVGSYLAYRLAEMGYRVVVLEQHQQVGEQVCCTGILSQECVNSFAVDSSVVLRPVNNARLFSPSGKWLRLWREETQAYIVDRPAFNRAIASQAESKGAEYRLNSLVTGLGFRDGGATVKATYQGERISLEARVVVIATGFGSRLTEGLNSSADFALGAQAEVVATGVDEVEVYFGQEVAPGFFAWLVPASPQRALVGLLTQREPGLYLQRLLSNLLSRGRITSIEVQPSYGGIRLKPLSRTYGDRLIVVGTAAGQVKPTTGGGIYFGLLSAEIAANTLHQGLKTDDLSARSLADYERKWQQQLGIELAIDYYARKFYRRLNDRQIDKIFDIIEANGIAEALLKSKDFSFDWHSGTVLRLMGHRVVAKALEVMKIPFRPWG